jgi:hypothetical protein
MVAALKLEFQAEAEAWQRYAYIVSWQREGDTTDYLSYPIPRTEERLLEMEEFMANSKIYYSKYMMKAPYGGTGMYKYIHAGFRFLTEEDAMMFVLRFQGEHGFSAKD